MKSYKFSTPEDERTAREMAHDNIALVVQRLSEIVNAKYSQASEAKDDEAKVSLAYDAKYIEEVAIYICDGFLECALPEVLEMDVTEA